MLQEAARGTGLGPAVRASEPVIFIRVRHLAVFAGRVAALLILLVLIFPCVEEALVVPFQGLAVEEKERA